MDWDIWMVLYECTHWIKTVGGLYFLGLGSIMVLKSSTRSAGIGCAIAAGLLLFGV
jgi:hypothetical protein